ncbi:Protein phosphatase 2C-like [Gracilariopsis chorda]|uniref:Protein phosphatase 2C-like n=1 Tax=Gracilariopsis chorda TaxID=448386 RepID=A0A2V3J0W1_9FLOR|nr:Protein phosphatase 2C-like [Gracilariopsis chorda]|eukprot:PXF48024.1 Protein phosphatase 2C-like [Gracilariopsis chorda]
MTKHISSPFPAAVHSTPGRASYQHDRHLIHHTPNLSLFLVADGHGEAPTGHTVANHIVQTFPALLHTHATHLANDVRATLRKLILSLDASAIAATNAARLYAGSTLCAVLRMGPLLYCANVGDSRAVVVSATRVRPLSQDHHCDAPAERARIESAGGYVLGGMLNGYISMSRSIGDDDLKAHRNITPFPQPPGAPNTAKRQYAQHLLTAEPDVTCTSVEADDLVSVVASDGVWTKLSNQSVAKLVRTGLSRGKSAHEIAQMIVKKAMSKGSRDNITAMVAFLWDDDHLTSCVGPRFARFSKRSNVQVQVKSVDSVESGLDSRGSEDGDGTSSDAVEACATEFTLNRETKTTERVDRVREAPQGRPRPRQRLVRSKMARWKSSSDAWRMRSLSTAN